MTHPIYFDITDIVRYAVNNDRVAGIPRVHFNLVAHLSRKHGGDAVRCLFHHSEARGMVEFDPTPLFEREEFDASSLLQQLGLEQPHRYFPRRRTIRNYLRRFDANKALRTLKKMDVYASSVFMPSRLMGMGLKRPSVDYQVLQLNNVDHLPDGAHMVILSIDDKRVLGFSRQHRQRGGDAVQLVYDLIPVVCTELFSNERINEFKGWLDELVDQQPRVICISEWTARDLRNYIGPGSSEWDIRAVPLAHELDGFARNEDVPLPGAAEQRLPQEPFLLCVGTLENRKNGTTLLRAWDRVLAKLGDAAPTLVFAGRHGWLIDEFMTLLKSKPMFASKVKILESPSDRDLAWLYRHCLFTVFPSFYEGWGLPVGEAAWFGKYTIASKTSSLPEVCGDLIDYIDPHDASDLALKMERALLDPGYVATREAAIRQAKLRRWTDVADDIFNAVASPPLAGSGKVDPLYPNRASAG